MSILSTRSCLKKRRIASSRPPGVVSQEIRWTQDPALFVQNLQKIFLVPDQQTNLATAKTIRESGPHFFIVFGPFAKACGEASGDRSEDCSAQAYPSGGHGEKGEQKTFGLSAPRGKSLL